MLDYPISGKRLKKKPCFITTLQAKSFPCISKFSFLFHKVYLKMTRTTMSFKNFSAGEVIIHRQAPTLSNILICYFLA